MKFGVVVFPGSNCDHDCYYVLNSVLGVKAEYIWHKETSVDGFDCVVLPGGFSYGDYLRTGSIARFSPVMNAVAKHARKGKLVIGICNGFQILLEAGLLPGAMLRNTSLNFICKDVWVKVENNETPFTGLCGGKETLRIPVAHGEGNYFADTEIIKKLESEHRVVLRYCSENGNVEKSSNPNGSLNNIAGICNERKNVLGLMPHPERCSEKILGSADGKKIFDSIRVFLRGS